MKNISSGFTVILKFIVPIFTTFFFIRSVVELIKYYEFWGIDEYLIVFVLLLINIYVFKFYIPLKSVKLKEDKIIVSNFRDKIEIPIDDIYEIKKGIKFITFHLSTRSEFGEEFVIYPFSINVPGSDRNADLSYIASLLKMKVTANNDKAVRFE